MRIENWKDALAVTPLAGACFAIGMLWADVIIRMPAFLLFLGFIILFYFSISYCFSRDEQQSCED